MPIEENSVKTITVAELAHVLADKSHTVADIRDAASFQKGHIPAAIHLTNESMADFMREVDLDEPVVVCCYHGISSIQAAQFLLSQDFTQVYSLEGGFTQWQLQCSDKVSLGEETL